MIKEGFPLFLFCVLRLFLFFLFVLIAVLTKLNFPDLHQTEKLCDPLSAIRIFLEKYGGKDSKQGDCIYKKPCKGFVYTSQDGALRLPCFLGNIPKPLL